MSRTARFSADVLAEIDRSRMLRIRAGEAHRFIGIWVVVVGRRVFVRSWDVRAGGWYRAFVEERRGAIRIGDREIAVRAVRTRSERVKTAVDRAYATKYTTPASRKYVLGFRARRRRDATLELVPA